MLLEESIDRVVISDFGLARAADDASLTRSGVIAGTPHYMSPEQARGEPIDGRSDLFGLGSVLYFMLTGRPPFRSNGAMGTLNRICHDPHRPVDDVNETVPEALAELVDHLLAKPIAKRPASAMEVAKQLNILLQDKGGRARFRRKRWAQRWQLAMQISIALVLASLIGFGVHSIIHESRDKSATTTSDPFGSEDSGSEESTSDAITAGNDSSNQGFHQQEFFDETFYIELQQAESTVDALSRQNGFSETGSFPDAWVKEIETAKAAAEMIGRELENGVRESQD